MRAVLKGAGYALVHVPDLVLSHGTTFRLEQPNSPLSAIDFNDIPAFSETVLYPPNQCYIGNIKPEDLQQLPRPWYENPSDKVERFGPYGEIMPQEEFIGLIKAADTFNLVELEAGFLEEIKEMLSRHPLAAVRELLALQTGTTMDSINRRVEKEGADYLFSRGNPVGCIKRAHEVDENLQAHILLENLATKASAFLALINLIDRNEVMPVDIDYVLETSEEACGDMNQRGGGNFAKAIAEMAGLKNATGADLRAFCAAPAHGIVNAAALVSAGIYRNVVVVGGGAVAKLGMNARDHLKKGVPILENVLGAFAVLISFDDGKNPVIRTDAIGRHRVGSGTSPQAVTTALIFDPLTKLGLTVKDVDRFSVEMQNPELTQPAGAGDVPLANYKMIAALGVKKGLLGHDELVRFPQEHGLVGWAPTQGHIPSGVPYLGFARDSLLTHKIKRAMFVGKGSLFLARMTSLFDGISFLLEPNRGLSDGEVGMEEVRMLLARALYQAAKGLNGGNEYGCE